MESCWPFIVLLKNYKQRGLPSLPYFSGPHGLRTCALDITLKKKTLTVLTWVRNRHDTDLKPTLIQRCGLLQFAMIGRTYRFLATPWKMHFTRKTFCEHVTLGVEKQYQFTSSWLNTVFVYETVHCKVTRF